jgi:hypothetical protein
MRSSLHLAIALAFRRQPDEGSTHRTHQSIGLLNDDSGTDQRQKWIIDLADVFWRPDSSNGGGLLHQISS